MDVGPFSTDPQGEKPKPVSWSDLKDYFELTQPGFETWEPILIHKMSKAFCSGIVEGRDPFSIMPTERDEYKDVYSIS